MLIDPASKAEKLIDILDNDNLVGILLTHGHFDHIKAVDGLYEKYHCPVYLNKEDSSIARDKNSGVDFGIVSYISCPINDIYEGRKEIKEFVFDCVYTPGHTKGSVIYIFDNNIFTGDTLFKGSIGRTDLQGGDLSELKHSLKLFKELKGEYNIFPGHEEPTTLSQELLNNQYLK